MRNSLWILASLLLVGCWQGNAADHSFVVEAGNVDVLDGDSFVVKQGRTEHEIRLFGIDAPEHRQPWARQARDGLRKIVAGHRLRIEPIDTDRYERTVARVYRVSDELQVNAQMIRNGHAWVYRVYTDDKRLIASERAARRGGVGLWSLPEEQRQPPWEWRREHGS